MSIYLFQANYTAQAWAAMIKRPEDRSTVISNLMSVLGGRLLNLYFTHDSYDVIAIAETPDAAAAMTGSVVAFSAEHLKDIKVTQLFTADETLQIMIKAGQITYAKPAG